MKIHDRGDIVYLESLYTNAYLLVGTLEELSTNYVFFLLQTSECLSATYPRVPVSGNGKSDNYLRGSVSSKTSFIQVTRHQPS